jgi:flagellar basal-body rod modification protein FlgD
VITPTSMLPNTDASSGTTSTTGTGLPSSQGLDTMFLQLLVAQLQNQDPTNPLDPSQFVGQLAQFSELSQVTQINQTLQQLTGSGSTSGTPPASGGSAKPANPIFAPATTQVISAAGSGAQAAVPNSTSPAALFLNHPIQGVF